jgi:hypothetical protein
LLWQANGINKGKINMAEYLPVRSYNRSQNVRIGKQKLSPTSTTYIDISDAATRKEFSYHSAIGAAYALGDITANNTQYAVHAATASLGSGAPAWLTTGTVTIASGVATHSGTSFTNDMVGGILTSGSNKFLVSSYLTSSTLGVTLISGSATVAAGSSYTIAYNVIVAATTSVTFIAGDIYDRVNELHTFIPAQIPANGSSISAPASTKSRRDIVTVNPVTGLLTVTAGDSAGYVTTGGTPNTVSVYSSTNTGGYPVGDIPVAYLTFRNGATTAQVTDLRQLV